MRGVANVSAWLATGLDIKDGWGLKIVNKKKKLGMQP